MEDKEDVAAFENFSMADIASDAPKAEATPEAPKEEKKEAVKAEAKKPENETASKKEVKGDKGKWEKRVIFISDDPSSSSKGCWS